MANRSIFEEVSDPQAEPRTAATGTIDRGSLATGGIRAWLMALFALVIVMIVVGGLTRLTDSGLSITEWNPVMGAIPPMGAEAWAEEFEKYKQIPEYQEQNRGMSLAEFKVIYWWEWGHRQLGRVIGLVWGVGFAVFLIRRQIPTGFTPKLLLLGALGGLQGFIGWWMVRSGLEDGMLDVASYRLATHLGLAFIILGLITWYMMQLSRRSVDMLQARRARDRRLFGWTAVLVGVCFVQILLGALVAGIDAGRAFPTWPLMGDGFLPPDPFTLEPVWRNFFEDPGLVQFIHRMTGYLFFALALFVWFANRRVPQKNTRSALTAMLAITVLQVVLGIVTVLYSAPWYWAILHQLIGVALWVHVLRARFAAGYPVGDSIRGATQ